MKKRILFVDDEPLALQGLQRMLRGMREEWEMMFAEGGKEALELLAQHPADVVISDMLMPGMNGAELLGRVRERHPKTARLILSGHSEKDMILNSIPATHQYLAKPCPPEMLKATLKKLTAPQWNGGHPEVMEVISKLDRLASRPQIYFALVETLQSPAATLEEVSGLVAQDPGLAANILKLVNSAYFGVSTMRASFFEAISHVGLDTLKRLVFWMNAFSPLDLSKAEEVMFESVAVHCLETAEVAREIARKEGFNQKRIEEAYAAGLLHDSGLLIFLAYFPEEFRAVRKISEEKKIPLIEAERSVFGASHEEVGAFLLNLWGFPEPMVEAVARHHSVEMEAGGRMESLAQVVGAANVESWNWGRGVERV